MFSRFLVRMRRNSVNSASGVKTAITIVFSDLISYKMDKIVAFENTISVFWAYFYCACAETAI